MNLRKAIVILCAAFAVALLSSCSGLAGEPQIVSTLPPATDIPAPSQAPDVALGAQVYAANCTRCHGVEGKGDGEFVQNGQIASPGDFTNAGSFADQSPVDFYDVITNGRLQDGMPPWISALSEQERWSVAYYVYTLANTQDQIARGRDLFNTNCADCDTSSLTSLDANTTTSRTDLIAAIGNMPEFASLTADQRADAAAYARTLALANADAVGTVAQATTEPTAPTTASGTPVANPTAGAAGAASTAETNPEGAVEATAEATAEMTGALTGQVTNGSAGGSVPTDLPLTLFIFDAQFNQQQLNGTANADGSYSFSDVPLDPTYSYVVTTNYRDRIFASDILSGDPLNADMADDSLSLPLTIYELTEDADVVQIDGLITQVSISSGSMEVAQVYRFTNTSDRAYTTSQTTDDGRAISLAITLPPGSVIAGFPSDQNRFVVDAPNATFYDTVPVLPGEQHLVQVIYLIQYDQDAIIEQPVNYAIDAPVRLLLTPENVSVTSDQLDSLGTQTLGSTEYASYGAQLTLPAGSILSYTLSGAGADTSGSQTTSVVSSNNLLLLVGGVVVIVILLGGGLFLIASRNRSGDQQVANILIRQIAELDTDHAAGKIDDESYQQQRDALKARLAALMEKKA